MQAAPARYVSASELYSTDEVELLLEEIRELEPTSCRGEDVQDFEIAGSGCAGAGGRSPAGTELTERSWDSHAHYSRAPPPRPRALAPVYCHLSYLITPTGGLTFLLVLCSLCVCICVWGALGLRAASAAKPLLFGALTSFMLHTLLMLMHISLLDALLPVDWNRFSGISFAWSASWLIGGAVALLVALPAPGAHSSVASMLYTAAGCALGGAGVALLGAGVCVRGGCARAGRAGSLRAAYRAVPQASTSRDRAL
ncbi:uncharacterized protein LOC126774752 [Nymphalis io]|uniref:uncharacterized protein LOC126774752 n=1 Tax=Inachis io TaxID=171585 RepID=UPI00216A52FC|nr:uncharacterized protein LOC126774752 [Nymphalis io]